MYDYRLDDAGISNFEDDDEDEERKVNMIFHATKTIRCIFAVH